MRIFLSLKKKLSYLMFSRLFLQIVSRHSKKTPKTTPIVVKKTIPIMTKEMKGNVSKINLFNFFVFFN